jgi:FSR family fosmidomycin resistance protein-like MFS transporter
MHEDQDNDFKGRGLGSFVAPGALGLFAGNLLAGNGTIRIASALVMIALWVWLLFVIKGNNPVRKDHVFALDDAAVVTILITVLVVIIRSYVGLAVSFSWKQGLLFGFLNVLCVACGKTLGGFCGSRFGYRKTVIVSLLLAAVLYLLGNISVCGLLAALLFNMTMPVTLYLLAEKMRHLEGFAFGILTFALFIGYYLKVSAGVLPVSPAVVAVAGSLLSVALLYMLVKDRKE